MFQRNVRGVNPSHQPKVDNIRELHRKQIKSHDDLYYRICDLDNIYKIEFPDKSILFIGWGINIKMYTVKLNKNDYRNEQDIEILLESLKGGSACLSHAFNFYTNCSLCHKVEEIEAHHINTIDYHIFKEQPHSKKAKTTKYAPKNINKTEIRSHLSNGYLNICEYCNYMFKETRSITKYTIPNKYSIKLHNIFSREDALDINAFYIPTNKYLAIWFDIKNGDNRWIENIIFTETKYSQFNTEMPINHKHRESHNNARSRYIWLIFAPAVIAITKFDIIDDVKRYIVTFLIKLFSNI